MKRIGYNSKIGCVLNVDMKPEVPWDRSVYGHPLNNHGSIWNLNGRYFDGVNDYINIPGSNSSGHSLDLLEDFTITAQTNGSIFNSYNGVVCKRGVPGYQFEFRFYHNNLNLLTSGGSITTTSNNSINTDYFIAVTRDNDGNTDFYINNTYIHSAASKSIAHIDIDVTIGAIKSLTHFFTGFYSGITLYNHILPAKKLHCFVGGRIIK